MNRLFQIVVNAMNIRELGIVMEKTVGSSVRLLT